MNRLIINIILLCLSPVFLAGNALENLWSNPDTIPPPPPAQPFLLSGPTEACVGETSTFTTEVPVACTCLWAINGVFQPGSGPEFSYTWTQPGQQLLTLEFVCGSQATEPDSLAVSVWKVPSVFLGNDTTINQGQTLLLDAGNPGSNYLWSTGATTQTILVNTAGSYTVTVSNPCGVDADEIFVSVFVGMPEDSKEEMIGIFSSDGKLIFKRLPEEIRRIQVLDPLGRIIYEGEPLNALIPGTKGLVIVRFFTGDGVLARKLIIP